MLFAINLSFFDEVEPLNSSFPPQLFLSFHVAPLTSLHLIYLCTPSTISPSHSLRTPEFPHINKTLSFVVGFGRTNPNIFEEAVEEINPLHHWVKFSINKLYSCACPVWIQVALQAFSVFSCKNISCAHCLTSIWFTVQRWNTALEVLLERADRAERKLFKLLCQLVADGLKLILRLLLQLSHHLLDSPGIFSIKGQRHLFYLQRLQVFQNFKNVFPICPLLYIPKLLFLWCFIGWGIRLVERQNVGRIQYLEEEFLVFQNIRAVVFLDDLGKHALVVNSLPCLRNNKKNFGVFLAKEVIKPFEILF